MKSGLRLFPGALTVVLIVAKIAMRTERSNRYQQDEQRMQEQNNGMEAFRGRLNGGEICMAIPTLFPRVKLTNDSRGKHSNLLTKHRSIIRYLFLIAKEMCRHKDLLFLLKKEKPVFAAKILLQQRITTPN